MIEQVEGTQTRFGQAGLPASAGETAAFAAVMGQHLGPGVNSADGAAGAPGRSRRDGGGTPAFGRTVDLAALAAEELVTQGSPRADVAAATEEMASTGSGGAHAGNSKGRSGPAGSPQSAQVGAEQRSERGSTDRGENKAPDGAGPATRPKGTEATSQGGPPTTAIGSPNTPLAGLGPLSRIAEMTVAMPRMAPSGSIPGTTASSKGVGAGPDRPATSPGIFKATPLPRPPGGGQEPLAAQVRRGLAAVLRQGGGSVLMRLSPEALGQLRIRLDLDGASVSARFDVGGNEARRLLEADLGALRSALEARGLTVEDLRVVVRAEPEATADERDPGTDARGRAHAEDRPESGGEPPDLEEMEEAMAEPWLDVPGGAALDTYGAGLIRLRLDTVA